MDLITAQLQFAEAVVADNVFEEWERIVVDAEIEEDSSGYRIDTVSFAIVRGADSQLTTPDFMLSETSRDAIIALYRERLDNAGDKFTCFGFEIDSDGNYRFRIGHEKPERLNGIFETERQHKINNYLEKYPENG